eukprot:5584632-Amphidinium_carterae.2
MTWTTWCSWTAIPGQVWAQVREPRPESHGIEGIIPDTGAIPNICGISWFQRLQEAGARTTVRPSSGRSLYGVGGNSPQVKDTVTLWLSVEAKNEGGQKLKVPITFTAELLPQPAVPALLGLNSMAGMAGKVDSSRGTMSFLAQDGHHYQIDMVKADTGPEARQTNHIWPLNNHDEHWDFDGDNLIRIHDHPRDRLFTALDDTSHGLPAEAFTGKRVTEKIYVDTSERELTEDNWRFASAPSKSVVRPWTGKTTLEILPEYRGALRNGLLGDTFDDDKTLATTTTPKTLATTTTPKTLATTTTPKTLTTTVAILHKFSSKAQEPLGMLESTNDMITTFADLARNPDEQRVQQLLSERHSGERFIIVLPGCPIKSGTRKDRRRASRAVLLLRQAALRGVVPMLVLPENSATLLGPDIQQLLSENGWSKTALPLCALGQAVKQQDGRELPLRSVLQVITRGHIHAPLCQHQGEHAPQNKLLPRPRPETIAALEFLKSAQISSGTPRNQVMMNLPPPMTSEVGVAVLEICGGTAAVSAEFLEKGYAVGSNVDIVTNPKFDLTTKIGRKLLKQVWFKEMPGLVCAAPPCTFLAGFSKLNSLHDPERYRRGQQHAEVIANIVANVCQQQHLRGRWFIIENPQRSDLWALPCIRKLMATSGVSRLVLDQCMYGLTDEKGVAIKKPTTMLTNLPHAQTFLTTRCNGEHDHQRLEGGARVSRAQVWPTALAQAIVNTTLLSFKKEGILQHPRRVRFETSGQEQAYPIAYDLCPGCRGHKPSLDPTHTRVEGECKWSDIEEATRRSRAYAPRPTSTTRLAHARRSFREVPRKAEVTEAATPETEHAAGSTSTPGLPDLAQETQIQQEEETSRAATRMHDDAAEHFPHKPTDSWKVENSMVTRTHRISRTMLFTPKGVIGCPDNIDLYPIRITKACFGDGTTTILQDHWKDEAHRPLHKRWTGETRFTKDLELDTEEAEVIIGDQSPSRKRGPKPTTEATTQASEGTDAPTTEAYDLSKVAATLRRAEHDTPVVRSIIRRLHHRWWHSSTPRMRQIMTAADVPQRVLEQIAPVVDSCSICRAWRKRLPRPQSTSSLPTRFNEQVQADILWIDGQPVLHLIDVATRFSQAQFLSEMNDTTVLEAIASLWIRIFGPMASLISDQEAGLRSDHAGTVMARWGTQRKLLPEGRHASIVERHHALMRSTYHKIRDQLQVDGLAVSGTMMLAEAVHAHNVITSVGGYSPHQAVFGRSPPLLQLGPDEHSHETIGDGEQDLDKTARVREIALQAMLQSLASDRIKRASKSHTHQAAGEMAISTGDLVDYYRQPVGKTSPGWRGPAVLVDNSTLTEDGICHVRWQGRVLSVQARDLRPHIPLPVFMYQQCPDYAHLWDFIDSINCTSLFFGTLIDDKTSDQFLSTHANKHPMIYGSLCRFSQLELGLACRHFLVGHGVQKVRVSSLTRRGTTRGLMIIWISDRMESVCELEVDLTVTLKFKDLTAHDGQHCSWVIFFGTATLKDRVRTPPWTRKTRRIGQHPETIHLVMAWIWTITWSRMTPRWTRMTRTTTTTTTTTTMNTTTVPDLTLVAHEMEMTTKMTVVKEDLGVTRAGPEMILRARHHNCNRMAITSRRGTRWKQTHWEQHLAMLTC